MYSVVTTNQHIAFYGMKMAHAASFCARTLIQSLNNYTRTGRLGFV